MFSTDPTLLHQHHRQAKEGVRRKLRRGCPRQRNESDLLSSSGRATSGVRRTTPTARWCALGVRGGKWVGAIDEPSDDLILVTYQSPAAHAGPSETGVLRARADVRSEPYLASDDSMERMATERLPTNGQHLLWLWAKSKRNQYRDSPVQGHVVMTLSVPREHVLPSEFGQWHDALNIQPTVTQLAGETHDGWWAPAEPILNDFDACLAEAGVGHFDGLPDALREEPSATWKAIFEPQSWHPWTGSKESFTRSGQRR